jgi:mRNA interferase RelE/StbE
VYQVLLAEPARRFYEDADAPLQRKLDRCIEVLRTDPRRHPNIKPLKGQFQGLYRFRVGDYRVVYRIEGDRVVIVAYIAHRREVY